MAITTQTVKIDLNTGKTIPVVYAHQNDTNRAIQFQVFNNGEAFNLSGYTVKFGYVSPKKNGQYTTINGEGMASGTTHLNLVSVTLPETYTRISGTGLLTMIISGSGASIRPINIRFEVQTSADGPDVMAGASDFPDAWMDEKVYSWLDDHIDEIFTEEQFADSVDAWLDDHPEATTTVQDGSITYAKLNSNINSGFVLDNGTYKYDYNALVNKPHIATSTVPTFEDLYDTTEDEVTVLEDDSYYGSGQTVTFMKSDVAMTVQTFFQRANGDYMVPKPRRDPPESNAPIAAIGETVASYINHPELVYGNAEGLFSTVCNDEMDCSMFSYAILQGITYENSRYNGTETNTMGEYVGDNIPRNCACYYSPSRPYGLKASEQALWFAEQNRLFYIDYEREHPCSQLQPGDLIFESGEPGANRYLSIHHVAVVLAVYPKNDRIVVAQAGGFDSTVQEYTQTQGLDKRRDNIKITTLKIINSEVLLPVFARPNYGRSERAGTSVQNQVYYNGDVSIQTSGNAKQLAQVFVQRPLNPHKMYTFSVKGNLPQHSTQKTNLEMSATINGSTVEFGVASNFDCGDVFSFPFVPPSEIESATAIKVRVYVQQADTLDTAQVNNIDSFGLYDSLIPNVLPNNIDMPNGLVPENGVTATAAYVWENDGHIHIRAALKLSTATASDGFVRLATINPDLFGSIQFAVSILSTTKVYACYYNGNIRAMKIDSQGAISVNYNSGEGAVASTIIDIVI